jgi:hypothetical protein
MELEPMASTTNRSMAAMSVTTRDKAVDLGCIVDIA